MNWHHANLIIGEIDSKKFVHDILKKDMDFDIKRNPDYFLYEKDNFGIDDARIFESWSILKPLSGDVKVAHIIFESITLDAENAMLKILEEPKRGVYMFLHPSSKIEFLPTFLSRVRVHKFDNKYFEDNQISDESKEILSRDFRRSIPALKKLIARDSTKKTNKIVDDIEQILYKDLINNRQLLNRSDVCLMSKLIKTKRYLKERSMPQKLILEWLLSVVP